MATTTPYRSDQLISACKAPTVCQPVFKVATNVEQGARLHQYVEVYQPCVRPGLKVQACTSTTMKTKRAERYTTAARTRHVRCKTLAVKFFHQRAVLPRRRSFVPAVSDAQRLYYQTANPKILAYPVTPSFSAFAV